MPKIYCPTCGFGTEYKLGNIPKSCSKCNKSTVIEVKPTPKQTSSVVTPPPPTTKGKWILVDDTDENEDDGTGGDTEYAAPTIKVDYARQEGIKFGDLAHQTKTGETGRPTQKLNKRQAKETVEATLNKAKGKTGVIEFN